MSPPLQFSLKFKFSTVLVARTGAMLTPKIVPSAVECGKTSHLRVGLNPCEIVDVLSQRWHCRVQEILVQVSSRYGNVWHIGEGVPVHQSARAAHSRVDEVLQTAQVDDEADICADESYLHSFLGSGLGYLTSNPYL